MNKQIEEMAKVLCGMSRECAKCRLNGICLARTSADVLYTAGYRKASDVAMEIFAEIEKFNRPPLPECEPVYIIKARELAELKKKYTESEGENDVAQN